jgi:hypothetical protein
VHWRAEDLHRGWCNELCHALAAYFLHSFREQVHRNSRSQQWREVEGGKDCAAVAEGEEGVGGWWKGARYSGTEETGEVCVFPKAEGEIGEGGCGEFGGTVSSRSYWGVAESGGCSIDGVCG